MKKKSSAVFIGASFVRQTDHQIMKTVLFQKHACCGRIYRFSILGSIFLFVLLTPDRLRISVLKLFVQFRVHFNYVPILLVLYCARLVLRTVV